MFRKKLSTNISGIGIKNEDYISDLTVQWGGPWDFYSRTLTDDF